MKIKHLLLCGITSWLFVVSLQGESLENGEVVPLEEGRSSSPLMMLGKLGEKKATPAIGKSDPRRVTEGDTDESGTPITDNSSDEARGAFSGIAEEEREDGSLTLDHFRRALDEHPEARRFIIVEDEENEHAISIQSRAAATSRLALKRNQAIIEALRELLSIRHGASSEIVNSFFGEQRENSPLTAAELREILRKSDDAQQSASQITFQKIAPQTSQIASPFHPLESEQTASEADDFNVVSNIDEHLGRDIRDNIKTIEKITLAEDLSEKRAQAEEAYKKALVGQGIPSNLRKTPLIEPTLSEEIKTHLKGQLLAELALETLQDAEAAANRLSTAYKMLPEFKKTSTRNSMVLAEKALVKAQEADLAARAARKKAYEMNFDREWNAYKTAEQAWDKAIIAYADLKDAFQNNPTLLTPLEQYLDNAEVRESLWKAYEPWIKARKTEQKIAAATVLIKADAEEARDCWNEVVEDYTTALSKARKAALNDMTLVADLDAATARSAVWSEKIAELDAIHSRAPIDLESQEQARLEAIRKNHQATIEAIHNEQYQRSYHQWSLPGELGDVSTSAAAEFQERNSEEIFPAKISEKELEKIGKELFKKERKKRAAASSQAARAIEATTTEHSGAVAPVKTSSSSLTMAEREDLAHSEIIIASLQPSAENEARWAAREKADKLLLEAAKIANTKKDRLEEMMELSEMDESKSAAFSSFPRNLSVIGSTVIGAKSLIQESVADKAARDLQKAMDAAAAADRAWEELVHQAEKSRINHGGMPLDSSDVTIFWEEADKKAFQAKREKEKIQKKETIAATHKEDWQANTARWEARMRANQCNRQANEVEEQADDLLQEQARINLKDELRSENAKRISEEVVEAKTTASTARAAATEAEEQWSSLANNHRSVIAAHDQGAEAIKAVLEKLKLSDQSVSNLWYEVTSRHSDDEFKEEKDSTKEQALSNKEATLYKKNLITERAALIAECFGKIDDALATAKKKYERSQAPEKKEAAKLLYDAIDEQEITARNAYAQKVQTAALKAAREKKPEEAWGYRLTESEKEKMTQEKISAEHPPSAEAWADEHQRSFTRATAITEVDRKAVKVFEKEKKRLADIGMLWEEIIEAKKKADRARRETAAQAHANGDMNAWASFTSEERQQYDQDVILADKMASEEATSSIEQASEAAKLARAQVRMLPSELFIKAAQKAQAALNRLQDQESERQRAIEAGTWFKKTPEERKAELEQKIAAARAQEEGDTVAAERINRATEQIALSNGVSPRQFIDKVMNYGTDPLAPGASFFLKFEKVCWQEALNYWEHAAEVDRNEEYEDFLFWKKAAEQEEASAAYYHEARQAEAAGHVENSKLWQAAAEQSQALAERYAQAVSILDSENKGERRQLNSTDHFSRRSASYLKASADYLKNAAAADAAGKQNTARLWREAAEQIQKLYEYEDQMNQCDSSALNNTEKDKIWSSFFDLSDANRLDNADCLKQSISYLIKAAQTERPEVNVLWTEAAKLAHSVAKWCYQSESINIAKKDFYNAAASILRAADQLALAAEFTKEKIEAEANGDVELARQWCEIAKLHQCSSKHYNAEDSACTKENLKNGNTWNYYTGNNFSQAAEKLNKAIKAEQSQKPEVAFLLKNSAAQYQHAADYSSQAAEARARGNEEEAECFYKAAKAAGGSISNPGSASQLDKAAEALEKAATAASLGQSEIAILWRNSATQRQLDAGYYSQAAEAYVQGNKEEAKLINENARAAGNSASQLDKALEALEKAATAASLGQSEIATLWKNSATQHQHAADYFSQFAEACVRGNDQEAYRFLGAVTARNNASFRLEDAVKALEKATIAAISDQLESERFWKNYATQYQHTASYFSKAAEAYARGNEQEAESFDRAAEAAGDSSSQLERAAESLEKSAAAASSGQSEIAILWRNSATQYQLAVDYFRQVAEAYVQGNKQEAECFDKAGKAAGGKMRNYGSAFQLERAVEALEKAATAASSGQLEIATLWKNSAAQRQQAANYLSQAAEPYARGNKQEAECFGKAARAAEDSNDQLERAVKSLEKATTAASLEQPETASLWKKSVVQDQHAADYYTQAAEAYVLGNKQEAERFDKAAKAAGGSSSQLDKAAEASKKSAAAASSGQSEIATLWKNSATQHQHAADYLSQAAEAIRGNKQEAGRFDKAAKAAGGSSSQLDKATEALEKSVAAASSGQSEIATLWKNSATQHQHAAGYFRQAAEAYLRGNDKEVELSKRAAEAAGGDKHYHPGSASQLEKAAEALEKSVAAASSGQSEIAILWKNSAVQDQLAADYLRQAAEAYAIVNSEKIDEGDSWYWAAKSVLSAERQISDSIGRKQNNALGTKANGDEMIVLQFRWNEAVREYQCATKFYQCATKFYVKAAEAYFIGIPEKTSEGTSWNNAGLGFYNAAEQIGKAIRLEVYNSGLAEAAAWRKAAEQNKDAGEYSAQAARARAARQENEGASWHKAGFSLLNAAEQLGKTIEANTRGNASLVNILKNAIKDYQIAVDLFIKAAEAHSFGTAEKTNEGHAWHNAGLGMLGATEQMSKVHEAKTRGDEALTAQWNEAMRENNRASEFSTMSVGAYAVGTPTKINEGKSWYQAGFSLLNAAEQMGKAIISEAEGKIDEAVAWRKAIEQYQSAAEHFIKAVKAYALGNANEGDKFHKTGLGLLDVAERMGKDIMSKDQNKIVEAVAEPNAFTVFTNAEATKTEAEEAEAKALAASPENGEIFNAAWNNAIQKGTAAKTAWDQVVQVYTHDRDAIPESKQSDWDEKLNSAKYYQADYAIRPVSLFEAFKAGKLAEIARNQAEASNPENEEAFKEAWNNALQKVVTTKTAWDQVIKDYSDVRNIVPENKKNDWNESLNDAKYKRVFYSTQSLWIGALKARKIATAARETAQATCIEDAAAFEAIWNDAREKATIAEAIWDQAAQSYLCNREAINESNKESWNRNLHEAQYWKARYALQPLFLEALKAEKISDVAKASTLAASPKKAREFETAWNDTIKKTRMTESVWNQVIQAFTRIRNTIPHSQQADWDINLTAAKYQKDHYAAELVSLEAARIEKKAAKKSWW